MKGRKNLNSPSNDRSIATNALVSMTTNHPSSTTSNGSSIISATSSAYRHSLQTDTYFANRVKSPKPKLLQDQKHVPRTRGSFGVLVVGLGGNKGTTLLAGILANRFHLEWRGAKGERKRPCDYRCCFSQSVRSEIQGLAGPSMAAVGGWDIRSAKLGDEFIESQILDYDLARQLREEMNAQKAFRGHYHPSFAQPNQEATYLIDEPDDYGVLKCLRADIRYFKWRNGVVGHTTVLCTPQHEAVSEDVHRLESIQSLLKAIECPEEERGFPLPPSLLYATAALLEGCSFLHVGKNTENTLGCPGLLDLVHQQRGVFCLGGALRTSLDLFHQYPIEVLETAGYQVQVAESRPTFIEYTAKGFLGQPTNVTVHADPQPYLLEVPLMIDAAVWCDYFSSRNYSYDKVVAALAYIFQDGGPFLEKMQECERKAKGITQLLSSGHPSSAKKRVRILPDEKSSEWAIPLDARIICAGLACVDMQLNQASGGNSGESIGTFEGENSLCGGSVSMACKTLARLSHGAPLDDEYMLVSPPVVNGVVPLCKIGNDNSGDKLLKLLEECGSVCRNVDTKYIREARTRDPNARTALAVLPIYKDGRRGCFFDAASNSTFSPDDMIAMVRSLMDPNGSAATLNTSHLSDDEYLEYHERVEDAIPTYGAFLFGYPHLLPKLQGDALVSIIMAVREAMVDGGIVALDLNGVPRTHFVRSGKLRTVDDLMHDPVIGPVLGHVDLLHMNQDELQLLTGCEFGLDKDQETLAKAVDLFLQCGVAIVAVTMGKKGSYIACNNRFRFENSKMLPPSWADEAVTVRAFELSPETIVNTNGAGDSFTAGLLVAAMLRHTGMTVADDGEDQDGGSDLLNGSVHSSEPVSSRHSETTSPPKKLTPYQLYMRENYVNLKQQCNDDKKAIFSKCHEMWENESDNVKAMYERKTREETEAVEPSENQLAIRLAHDMEKLDSTRRPNPSPSNDGLAVKNLYMTNRSLNLESAVQFASLIAAHHIDIGTRDLAHLDVTMLLERALIFPEGLEEI